MVQVIYGWTPKRMEYMQEVGKGMSSEFGLRRYKYVLIWFVFWIVIRIVYESLTLLGSFFNGSLTYFLAAKRNFCIRETCATRRSKPH